jgi:uncharacterized protein (TIGR02996 family)
MNSEAEWRKALKKSPDDKTLLLAYGDWLEEQGELLRACQAREKAGTGTLVYSLWHPSWGEERGGEWRKLAHLKSHVRNSLDGEGRYVRSFNVRVAVSELIVIIEWRTRPVEIARRPYSPELRL